MEQRKKSLQRDLEIYLAKRKRGRLVDFFKKKGERSVYDSIVSFLKKLKEPKVEELEFVGEKEEIKESAKQEKAEEQGLAEEELKEFEEKPKRNFLQDLIKFLTPTRRVKEEEILEVSQEAVTEQIESESKEDMKLLAKTVIGMMEHISPDEVKHLKNTQEFSTFKELLRKYKIIK